MVSDHASAEFCKAMEVHSLIWIFQAENIPPGPCLHQDQSPNPSTHPKSRSTGGGAGREQGLMEGALFCLGKAKEERRLLLGPHPGMPGDRCGDHKPLWTDCRGR